MQQPHDPNTAPPVTRRNPPTIWDMTVNGFSQISVAEAGRLAFLSGQVAAPAEGEAMPVDVGGQARFAAANLSAALDDLKASAADIVMIRIYVVDATTDRFQQALYGISKADAIGGLGHVPENGVVHRHEGIRGDVDIARSFRFDPSRPVGRVTIRPASANAGE